MTSELPSSELPSNVIAEQGVIQFFHLYKLYERGRFALEDINLKIGKGEFVLLVGPSGAGKSTLLRLILYEEIADRGQILIDGKNLSRLRDREISMLRRKIGFVFQDFKLIGRKTVFDNIALPLEISGCSRSEINRRVREALQWVQMEHRGNRSPAFLSGGEQQRVAIARALIGRPSIVLADEPTGNLDELLSRDIADLLKMIHTMGTTMVIATHHPALLSTTSRRTILLQQGKIISDGPTK